MYVRQYYVMRFRPVAFLVIKCQGKNKYHLAKRVGYIYDFYTEINSLILPTLLV